jgi:hypothetical protein
LRRTHGDELSNPTFPLRVTGYAEIDDVGWTRIEAAGISLSWRFLKNVER